MYLLDLRPVLTVLFSFTFLFFFSIVVYFVFCSVHDYLICIIWWNSRYTSAKCCVVIWLLTLITYLTELQIRTNYGKFASASTSTQVNNNNFCWYHYSVRETYWVWFDVGVLQSKMEVLLTHSPHVSTRLAAPPPIHLYICIPIIRSIIHRCAVGIKLCTHEFR